jgi:hypothetical protein
MVPLASFAAFTPPSQKREAGEQPAARSNGAAVGMIPSVLNGSDFVPILREPAQVLSVHRFPHDKRQPRPPRHRSERAGSYAAELELAAVVIDSITHDDAHGPVLADTALATPLSGHPLELLRPPSVCA